MKKPANMKPVLARIHHQNSLGNSKWYEVVYYDGEKWCPYAGSETFNDGQQVMRWKYSDECL